MARMRWVCAPLALAIVVLWAAPAAAQLPNDPAPAWVPNSSVQVVAHHGNTTYIGGRFTYVGPATGRAVALSAEDASLRPQFPQVTGTSVTAVESDGAGGWYLGGRFTHVGGVPRRNLAHVLPDGSVDPAFAPNPDGDVSDIERNASGTRLYVAGWFANIDGAARARVAAFALPDQTLSTWAPQVVGSSVSAVTPHPASPFVYLGGAFDSVGGAARQNLAEVSASTGAPTAYFTTGANSTVNDIEVWGAYIYVAGAFSTLLGSARNGLGAVAYSTGAVAVWDPALTRPGPSGGIVYDIDVEGSVVYAAGEFDHVGATPRTDVAAIAAVGAAGAGSATAWDPSPSGNLTTFSGDATSIEVAGSTVYVGGNFTAIGGAARNGLAAIDAATGDATAWHGDVGNSPLSLAVAGDTVVAGGIFNSAKGVRRLHLAALGADGAATSWDPRLEFNQEVLSLLVSPDGSRIYVGGDFSTVGDVTRSNLAAVDAAGAVTGWNPAPDGQVRAMTLSADGQTLYAGGEFEAIGGAARKYLAAVSTSSGAATGFDPSPDDYVNALALAPDGASLYAGGQFGEFPGPIERPYLAEIDLASGAPTAWNPAPDSDVHALAVAADGKVVYAGGEFSTVGTDARDSLAALDAATGKATAFDAGADTRIHSLALAPDGATLFVGAQHTGGGMIGGEPRPALAQVDAVTGAATSWNPEVDDDVFDLAVAGGDLHIGGEFRSARSLAVGGYARFLAPLPPPPPPGPGPSAPGPGTPPVTITPTDTVPPVLSGVRVTNRRFAVGKAATPVAARRAKRGTAFRWTLSEPATVRIQIRREQRGLRVGKRCRRATAAVRRRVVRSLARRLRGLEGTARAKRLRALLRKRRCVATARQGLLTRSGTAGANRAAFSGRIGRRALRPGRYRAVVIAADAAGNPSAPATVRFRIVRR